MGPLFHRVCIIGLGLIGGSLAMACKRYGLADEVVGADEDHSVAEKALHRGAIDRLTSGAKDAVEDADLVVLAVPVGAMAEAARAVREAVPAGAIVTDVGSVKGDLVGVLEELFSPSSPFVGGHPVAGAETSGLESASADLFAGSRCILTPTSRTNPRALDRVASLWRGMGAEVVTLDPQEHDWAMAAVSHLPHVASYALAKAVSTVDRGPLFVGPGFRDFSRLASSPAALWSDICLNNRDSLLAMIGRYQEALEMIRALIAAGAGAALEREFQQAREVREQLIRSGGNPVGTAKELLITIDGPAGAGKSTAAEQLASALGYTHVSTGDIYRAVAWLALQAAVDPREEEAVLELIRRSVPEFRLVQGRARVFAGGEDISARLRSEEVGRAASVLSAHPRVREALLPAQRRTAQWRGVVVDGRDAGTVIFPEAEIKFFLDASPQERARRRYLELKSHTQGLDPSRVLEDLNRRDLQDSRRAAAPLQIPKNAVVVDSTGLTPEEVVARMVETVSAYRMPSAYG